MSPVYGYSNNLTARPSEAHGGNVYRLAEELGLEVSEIIDFSASINPLGVPKSVVSAIKDNIPFLVNYPDPDAKELSMAIARHLEISSDYVLCGNGSTEIFYLLTRALTPESIMLTTPTFSEYQKAFEVYLGSSFDKSRVLYFPLIEANNFLIDPGEFIRAMAGGKDIATVRNSPLINTPDMVFLCNPNNPTASMLSKTEVLKVAEAAQQLRCYLVVDEAFIDFCPEHSVAKEVVRNPYLIVVRSLTKFYALAGLRLGYAIVNPKLMPKIRQFKEPWTVNTLAQVAGIAALNDRGYAQQTLKLIETEKVVLEDGFKALKIKYYPSAVNFYLIKLDNAQEVLQSLRQKGILLRDCSNFTGLGKGYLRVAVKSNKDNMRLLKELVRLCVVS